MNRKTHLTLGGLGAATAATAALLLAVPASALAEPALTVPAAAETAEEESLWGWDVPMVSTRYTRSYGPRIIYLESQLPENQTVMSVSAGAAQVADAKMTIVDSQGVEHDRILFSSIGVDRNAEPDVPWVENLYVDTDGAGMPCLKLAVEDAGSFRWQPAQTWAPHQLASGDITVRVTYTDADGRQRTEDHRLAGFFIERDSNKDGLADIVVDWWAQKGKDLSGWAISTVRPEYSRFPGHVVFPVAEGEPVPAGIKVLELADPVVRVTCPEPVCGLTVGADGTLSGTPVISDWKTNEDQRTVTIPLLINIDPVDPNDRYQPDGAFEVKVNVFKDGTRVPR